MANSMSHDDGMSELLMEHSSSMAAIPPPYKDAAGYVSKNRYPGDQQQHYTDQAFPAVQGTSESIGSPSVPLQNIGVPVGGSVHDAASIRVITGPALMGPKSTKTVCPSCHMTVSSSTVKVNKNSAYFGGILLGVLGCWCCCCIPCCMDSCKKVHHSCPGCGAYLGTFIG